MRQTLDALGARPDSTVFVGDSTHDLASGRAAGVRTAAALWGPNPRGRLAPYEPTWWLESPLEVLDLPTRGRTNAAASSSTRS